MPRLDVESFVFTSGQATELTGVPFSQLNHWARTGFLCPSVQDASGLDSCRAYAFGDLVALAAAKRLRDSGLEVDAIRSVVRYVQKRDYHERQSRSFLVGTNDGKVSERTLSDVAVALRDGKGFAWVLDIGAVIAGLRIAGRNLNAPKRGKARNVERLAAAG